MLNNENSTPAPNGASGPDLAALSDHIETQGGILAQVEAVRHMSVMLNEALQRKLAGPCQDEGKAGYVTAQFYAGEIDRLIWLAGEIQERSQKLGEQMDALYDDLTEMGPKRDRGATA